MARPLKDKTDYKALYEKMINDKERFKIKEQIDASNFLYVFNALIVLLCITLGLLVSVDYILLCIAFELFILLCIIIRTIWKMNTIKLKLLEGCRCR